MLYLLDFLFLFLISCITLQFLITVVQLNEVHMSGVLRFVVQYFVIMELYGFVWLGNLMKEMIQNGEIPL